MLLLSNKAHNSRHSRDTDAHLSKVAMVRHPSVVVMALLPSSKAHSRDTDALLSKAAMVRHPSVAVTAPLLSKVTDVRLSKAAAMVRHPSVAAVTVLPLNTGHNRDTDARLSKAAAMVPPLRVGAVTADLLVAAAMVPLPSAVVLAVLLVEGAPVVLVADRADVQVVLLAVALKRICSSILKTWRRWNCCIVRRYPYLTQICMR